jgi:predicted anti-sigma-YlaC factor YlaD
MSCEYYQELLSAALDGELQRVERSELDAHLEVCAACRQFGEAIDAIHDLAAAAVPHRLPAAGQRRILHRTVGRTSFLSWLRHSIPGARQRPRTLAWAGSLVVLVFVVGIAVIQLWRNPENIESPPARTGQNAPVLEVTISDNDIVATSSTVKISLTHEDIVGSTTLILSGGEM